MQIQGISRRNYERLPQEIKSKIAESSVEIKSQLRHCGFSLRFLGMDGRWKDLTAPRLLSQSEEIYRHLIMGSKWVTSTKRRDLVDKISELYELAAKVKLENLNLEKWLISIQP